MSSPVFSANYSAARAHFLETASQSGAVIHSLFHPIERLCGSAIQAGLLHDRYLTSGCTTGSARLVEYELNSASLAFWGKPLLPFAIFRYR
jgi:hypothetical protein